MLAKKFGFGFGIAIILPIMIHYGVSTFSPKPKWQDYQDSHYYQNYQKASEEEKEQLQAEREKRDTEYRSRERVFQRHLFFVATPLGLIAIIVGSFLAVQAIGAGLIFGGIFTLVDGYCWYWSELDDWMRFLSLFVAFVVLIVVGYTKMNKKV